MNLTLTLPSSLRDVVIDGEPFVLVRRAALDALFSASVRPATSATPAATQRPERSKSARKAKARRAKPLPAHTGSSVNGSLRDVILAEIQQTPGRTSLQLFDTIQAKMSITSGAVYMGIKSWVAKGKVEGRETGEGTKGWYPRSDQPALD